MRLYRVSGYLTPSTQGITIKKGGENRDLVTLMEPLFVLANTETRFAITGGRQK